MGVLVATAIFAAIHAAFIFNAAKNYVEYVRGVYVGIRKSSQDADSTLSTLHWVLFEVFPYGMQVVARVLASYLFLFTNVPATSIVPELAKRWTTELPAVVVCSLGLIFASAVVATTPVTGLASMFFGSRLGFFEPAVQLVVVLFSAIVDANFYRDVRPGLMAPAITRERPHY